MNKYTQIVKLFKLRKYYKGSKRFSSKKFITETLPRRFKKITKLQPEMFRFINETSKNSKKAILKIFENERLRLKSNEKYYEKYKNKEYKYKPNLYVRFFLKSSNIRNFDKKLNQYFRESKQTRGIFERIEEKSKLLTNKSLNEQNRNIILYFKELDKKKRENRERGLITDSDKLIELVANELDIKLNKEYINDESYNLDEDDEYNWYYGWFK